MPNYRNPATMLAVYISSNQPVVMTQDEQGRVLRSIHNLICHAANRHASRNGGRFYLGSGA